MSTNTDNHQEENIPKIYRIIRKKYRAFKNTIGPYLYPFRAILSLLGKTDQVWAWCVLVGLFTIFVDYLLYNYAFNLISSVASENYKEIFTRWGLACFAVATTLTIMHSFLVECEIIINDKHKIGSRGFAIQIVSCIILVIALFWSGMNEFTGYQRIFAGTFAHIITIFIPVLFASLINHRSLVKSDHQVVILTSLQAAVCGMTMVMMII